MKTRLAWLALAAPLAAQGVPPVWVGPDCRISWNHNPEVEFVQGYNVHVRSRKNTPAVTIDVNVGYMNETTCSALQLEQGKYRVWVTAYNPVGESGPSEKIPFVLVTGAPDTPAVTSPTGILIESAGGS